MGLYISKLKLKAAIILVSLPTFDWQLLFLVRYMACAM